jgi:hypothetical protein
LFQVDEHVISLMDEESLSKYFPKYGDQLAVRDFCSKKYSGTAKRKLGLLEKFRSKIRSKDNKSIDDQPSPTIFPNDIAMPSTSNSMPSTSSCTLTTSLGKPFRQIHLGWLMVSSDGKKLQVREKQGGGIRKPVVSRDANKKDLLELGKNLFFPGGTSVHKGCVNDYDIDIVDYQMNTLEESVTVGELYTITKLSHLRFYFSTTPKVSHKSVEPSHENFSLNDTIIVSDHEDSFEHEKEVLLPNVNVETVSASNDVGFDLIVDSNESCSTKLVIHRGRVVQELIQAFQYLNKDHGKIEIEMILPNGQPERAVDAGMIHINCIFLNSGVE